MKFLADENIPLEVVDKLKKDGVDIISASVVNPGISDEAILSLAKSKRRILITFDTDFGKLIFNGKKENCGVILLRFIPQTIGFIYSMIRKVLSKTVDFEKSFCVDETLRLRVIRLQ